MYLEELEAHSLLISVSLHVLRRFCNRFPGKFNIQIVFSIPQRVKNVNCSMMTDLNLERLLHCKKAAVIK